MPFNGLTTKSQENAMHKFPLKSNRIKGPFSYQGKWKEGKKGKKYSEKVEE